MSTMAKDVPQKMFGSEELNNPTYWIDNNHCESPNCS